MLLLPPRRGQRPRRRQRDLLRAPTPLSRRLLFPPLSRGASPGSAAGGGGRTGGARTGEEDEPFHFLSFGLDLDLVEILKPSLFHVLPLLLRSNSIVPKLQSTKKRDADALFFVHFPLCFWVARRRGETEGSKDFLPKKIFFHSPTLSISETRRDAHWRLLRLSFARCSSRDKFSSSAARGRTGLSRVVSAARV